MKLLITIFKIIFGIFILIGILLFYLLSVASTLAWTVFSFGVIVLALLNVITEDEDDSANTTYTVSMTVTPDDGWWNPSEVNMTNYDPQVTMLKEWVKLQDELDELKNDD